MADLACMPVNELAWIKEKWDVSNGLKKDLKTTK